MRWAVLVSLCLACSTPVAPVEQLHPCTRTELRATRLPDGHYVMRPVPVLDPDGCGPLERRGR